MSNVNKSSIFEDPNNLSKQNYDLLEEMIEKILYELIGEMLSTS